MKLYFVLKRSFFAMLFLLAVSAILICGEFFGCAITEQNGNTHKNRMEFVKSLGYEADENSAEVQNIEIPYVFSDIYEDYNSVQLSAGYDLLPYCGCKAEKYTYKLINNAGDENEKITLIVAGGKIIGGDISSAQLGGNVLPLTKNTAVK